MRLNILRIAFFAIGAILAWPASIARADDAGFFDSFQRLDLKRWYISNGWANGDHQSCEWRASAVSIGDGKLQLQLSDRGGLVRPLGCPEMHTDARLGYGIYEARMRTAAGSGLNTAFFTYVGPPVGVPQHDEIDFEFLGKDTHSVQLNYFTNGKGTKGILVPLGFDASAGFHNYAIEWAPSEIRWYVDGKQVYETPQGAALPHNPGRLYLSLWSGSKIEDAWMGLFSYTAPVKAEVAWAAYTPFETPCQFPESITCKKP